MTRHLLLLAMLLLSAPRALADLAIIGSASSTYSGTANNHTLTFSTSGAALIVVMFGAASTAGQDYPLSTLTGSTLGSITISRNDYKSQYYHNSAVGYVVAGGALTNEVITATLSGTPGGTVVRILAIVAVTGYDTGTPIGATATRGHTDGTGLAYAVPITPQAAGSHIFVALGTFYPPGGIETPNASSSLVVNYAPADHGATAYRSTNTTPDTSAITIGSSTTMGVVGWVGSALEVRAAAGGGPTGPAHSGMTGFWGSRSPRSATPAVLAQPPDRRRRSLQ